MQSKTSVLVPEIEWTCSDQLTIRTKKSSCTVTEGGHIMVLLDCDDSNVDSC